jgi:hypothetical protein
MKRLLVLLTVGLISICATAQEICNNGRDDDGDGFIDCYDNACSASTFCKDFFLGEDANVRLLLLRSLSLPWHLISRHRMKQRTTCQGWLSVI